MGIEIEVAKHVYRLMELHEAFSDGNYDEMNDYYSNDFTGWMYMPRNGEVVFLNGDEIKEGNQEAAKYYEGKKIRFTFTGLTIIPQDDNQAVVSYQVIHRNEGNMVRALSMEVWKKEADNRWRIIRLYQEKGTNE